MRKKGSGKENSSLMSLITIVCWILAAIISLCTCIQYRSVSAGIVSAISLLNVILNLIRLKKGK